MHTIKDVSDFITCAVEASVYVSPKSPGLSYEELQEAAAGAGFKLGETDDALGRMQQVRWGKDGRMGVELSSFGADFLFRLEPEYRSPEAFEFVRVYFRNLAAEMGEAKAQADRGAIVAAGVAKGIKEHDLDVALTMLLVTQHLTVAANGTYEPPRGRLRWALPSEQRAQRDDRKMPPRRRPQMEKAYALVKDIVARRTDGRAPAAEPVKAFEHALAGLDCVRFRMWWAQTAGELQRANTGSSPMITCVLSAALAEGALVLIVKRAQTLGLATMASKTFGQSPTSWKFDDLLSSAAAGGPDAIFDTKVRDRAARLNAIRNRIHVGRLMAEQPTGPIPDTRPEEAREARETLDIILRRILDWLDAHPAPAAPA
jgi:hypothetical protein